MIHSEFEWEKKFVNRKVFGVKYGILAVLAPGWSYFSLVLFMVPKMNVLNNTILIIHGLVGDWGG